MAVISDLNKSSTTPLLRTFITWLGQGAALLLAFCLAVPAAQAAIYESERVRISGFATIGITEGGNDILGYRRNVSQHGNYGDDIAWETDSLLGLQLDLSFSDAFSAAIQGVAKKRFNNSIENSIEWAYLRYRHNPNLTLRAGRIGLDLYMLSEYRNVGFSYLWARLPVEFYSPTAFFYFDGADINYSFNLGDGVFNTKLFGGSSENQFEFDNEGRDFKLNNLYGLVLGWESEHWRTRFTFTSVDYDRSLNKAVGTELFREPLMMAYQAGWTEALDLFNGIEVDNEGIDYYSLGLAYDNAPWIIQSEISFLDTDYELIKPYTGRYLSVGYRLGPTTVYGILAKAKQTEPRTEVGELPAHLANIPEFIFFRETMISVYDSSYADQESLSLGMRWNIRYDLALKMQWDHTRVEPAGGLLWEQREAPREKQTLNTYSINLNYIF